MRAAILAMTLTLAACGTGETGTADAACRHFHNVATDATDGVLTDSELRTKLQQVEDTAAGSDVADEARAMVATFTSGTAADFDAAVRSMSSACDPYR